MKVFKNKKKFNWLLKYKAEVLTKVSITLLAKEKKLY